MSQFKGHDNTSLITDFYELKMAAAYFENYMLAQPGSVILEKTSYSIFDHTNSEAALEAPI